MPSAQQIILNQNNQSLVKVVGTSNDTNVANVKSAVSVIAAADPPDGTNGATKWTQHTGATFGIGLNVSEPLPNDPNHKNYYDEPTVANSNAIDLNYKVSAYDKLDGTGTQTFKDSPYEGTKGNNAGNTLVESRPLVNTNVYKTGNYPLYKYVFLQRLADPTLPFDAMRNPYITVDWMPIDLTTFNGEQPWNAQAKDPDDPQGGTTQLAFASRQRGGSDPTKLANQKFNLWEAVHAPPAFPAAPAGDGDQLPNARYVLASAGNFKFMLAHSIGFLNQAFGPAFTGATMPQTNPAGQYLGDPDTSAGSNVKPFPWLTWNARPYANLMELLLVPGSSPDRLFMEFGSADTLNEQQYQASKGGGWQPKAYTPGADPLQTFRYPFAHLLNFVNSADKNSTPGQSANYYRVLEYLRVPSRFIGTETVLNPKVFSTSNANAPGFLPPFNIVSNYRDPGLVNINTVTSSEVWDAVRNGIGPDISGLNTSRGPSANSGGRRFRPSIPAPFRSAACADLVPLPGMMRPSVEATLLRPDSTGQVPLFGSVTQGNWAGRRQAATVQRQLAESVLCISGRCSGFRTS